MNANVEKLDVKKERRERFFRIVGELFQTFNRARHFNRPDK